MTRRTTMKRALAAGLFLLLGGASAQDRFPTKPVTLVVPYATGGVTDLFARAMAPRLSEILGQPVLVDNRAGAGTIIGTQMVARAAPDGYTILLTSYAYTSNPVLRKTMPYDAPSLAPLMLLGTTHNMLLLGSKAKPVALPEVIAYAKTSPGQLKLASSGNASSPHIAAELFAKAVGAKITHLPYKGTGPAMNDVIGGQVDGIFDGVSAMPQVRAGRLRPIAIAAEERHPLAPDVPTFRELGLDLVFGSWFGFLLPAGVPPPVQARLLEALHQAVDDPGVRDQLARTGLRLNPGSPQQFAAFLKSESRRLQSLVDGGAQIEVE